MAVDVHWLTIPGLATGTRVPPLQHPQRLERDPRGRVAWPVVHVKPHLPRRLPVQCPPPVSGLFRSQQLDRLAKTRVGRRTGVPRTLAEIVESAQNVVAPAMGMQQGQKLRVRYLSVRLAAKECA